MPDHYTVTTFRDIDGEKSTFQLPNGAITGASIAGFLAEYGDLKAALDALTLGVLAADQWVGDRTNISDALPGSNFAQRELKLKFTMDGSGDGGFFHRTLPCPDLSLVSIVPNTGGAINLTVGAEMIAAVAAIEAIGRHPDDDTQTITVVKCEVVGRNI
mgnify:CR=1 FL=1